MANFGELIKSDVPVLICFYTEWNEISREMNNIVAEVSLELSEKIKVIKIDIDKNEMLADALRIKTDPTLMIYNNGEMSWRNAGEMTKDDIVALLEPYL